MSIKKGGNAIAKPEERANLNYLASACECSHLLDALKGKEIFDPVYHTATMKEVREEMKKKKLATSDDIEGGKWDAKEGISETQLLEGEGDRDVACSNPKFCM